MELSTQQLVKRLCYNLAKSELQDAQRASDLSAQLFDTAFSALIRLDSDADVQHVAPDSRPASTAAALDQASDALRSSSYAELASSLTSLAAKLRRLDTTYVLGTKAEQLSGAPAALALTEQDAVLGFLLGLQGTRLSVRRRQVTNQTAHEAPAPCATGQLGSAVFAELPDPYALTDISSTVALLPSECGYPSDPFAGACDVQELSSCMSARPAWDPTATAHVPKPPGAAWLPVAPPLLEMHGDRRRGARPPPLGLPWSLLSMAEQPGAATGFQPMLSGPAGGGDGGAAVLGGDSMAAAGSGAGHGVAGASALAGQGPPGAAAVEVRELPGPCRLWSLEEADMAREGLLALQGVHTALMRLRGMLAVPRALPRLSVAGILARLAAAAELRQRLQLFVAAHLPPALTAGATPAPAGGPSAPADPVLQAFAVAVADVLRQQAAALQALEREESTAWVRRVEVGGEPGAQLHRRGLTLLQVALHTGRLQSHLQSLAALCWCLPHQQAGGGVEAAGAPPGDEGASFGQWEGFPRGPALLTYLHQALVEADDLQLPALRFLFGRALQPYLAHLRSWVFTSAPLAPEFAARGEEALAPCLEFLPPAGEGGGAADAGRQMLGEVPCEAPSFLQPVHAALVRAGAQLRLLSTLPRDGRDLVSQLGRIAGEESRSFLAAAAAGTPASMHGAGSAGGGTTGGSESLGLGRQGEDEEGEEELVRVGERQQELEAGRGWLSLGSSCAVAEEQAGVSLLATSSQLQQAAASVEQADVARMAAVEGWLEALAHRRRLDEQAAAAEALGRTATIRERHQQAAARRLNQAMGQRASKAQLLRQQSDEVAAKRARVAAERAQQLAEERHLLMQAALKEHSAAVAELAAALAGASVDPSIAAAADGSGLQDGGSAVAGTTGDSRAAPPVVDEAAVAAPWLSLAPSPEPAPGDAGEAAPAAGPAGSAAPAGIAHPPVAARGLTVLEQADAAGGPCPDPAAPPSASQQPRPRWQHISAALGAPAPRVVPALASFGEQVQRGDAVHPCCKSTEAPAREERPVPLSAVLETCVMQSVLSQYRAVSRACVRLFLEDQGLLGHLEALRRAFFMGAGDWADAFVAQLGAHADSLEPLSQHTLERMLQDALRGSCLEHDPHAARLRVTLLPGLSTVNAQVQAVSLPTPRRRGKLESRVPVSMVVPPSALDCLDCVALEYDMGWPLSAVLTEDTMQGYAAVFSMLVRLKRVEQLLRALHAPLKMQPKSTADVLLSEEEEDRAYRRLQRLRGFRHGAAQLVAAVQAFLHSRTSGPEWLQLLAKLMVSSEEVAASVLSRGPSAVLTGLLSRMGSIGGSGSAAHRLVRMARSLSRQGSQNSLARQGSSSSVASPSQPGSPRSTAATAAAGGGLAPGAEAAPRAAGPGPSRLGRADSAGGSALAAPGAALDQSLTGATAALAPQQQQQQQQATGPFGGGLQGAGKSGSGGGGGGDGISDLQELLDLHRAYIRAASSDCLTFGGCPAVREAVDAALQAAIQFAMRLQAAVRLGGAEGAWAQVLRRDATWGALEESMAAFAARAQALQGELGGASAGGVLAELALQIDFNCFYTRQRQQEQGRTAAGRAGD